MKRRRHLVPRRRTRSGWCLVFRNLRFRVCLRILFVCSPGLLTTCTTNTPQVNVFKNTPNVNVSETQRKSTACRHNKTTLNTQSAAGSHTLNCDVSGGRLVLKQGWPLSHALSHTLSHFHSHSLSHSLTLFGWTHRCQLGCCRVPHPQLRRSVHSFESGVSRLGIEVWGLGFGV